MTKIRTWKERVANLDKPTDFTESWAAKMEAGELRREIDRLNAEWMAKCEELRKDSERYRRIRLGLSNVHGDVYAMVFAGDGDYPEDGDALDRAVDASLAKKEGA